MKEDIIGKELLESVLVNTYNGGYNDAIEDVIEYLYSVKAPNLGVYLQAELAASFRTFKKLNKHVTL